MAESLQSLKIRQKGVHNINQITKAMELVAATKMRRSQEIALSSRPYAFAALDLLANLSRVEHVKLPKIFERREVKKSAVVVITSDKGLAGAFNANVLKAFERFFNREKDSVVSEAVPTAYIAIGQKAAQYVDKKTGVRSEKYTRVGDYTTVEQVRPIADMITEGYLSGKWDRVTVFSMNFKSALTQEVIQRELFPIDIEALRALADEIIPKTGRYAKLREEGAFAVLRGAGNPEEYIIEPNPDEALTALASHLVLMEIYHLVLEANASEHAARRMAMKSASDNAKELSSALSLQYNKSRQASITREIIEVSAGAEALA
jgi:F-type H+-transporting ATPase subunit gamma